MSFVSEYTRLLDVKNYSVYSDGPIYNNFYKLYKGIIIIVDMNNAGSPEYVRLSIKAKKAKDKIWKRGCEKLNKIVFDDETHSVFCDYEQEEKNKSLKEMIFDIDTYNEIKEYLPQFMNKCGCVPKEVKEAEGKQMLLF